MQISWLKFDLLEIRTGKHFPEDGDAATFRDTNKVCNEVLQNLLGVVVCSLCPCEEHIQYFTPYCRTTLYERHKQPCNVIYCVKRFMVTLYITEFITEIITRDGSFGISRTLSLLQ